MQCPHCGNEIYAQPITQINAIPNTAGCASPMGAYLSINNQTLLAPSLLGPSVCAGGLGFTPLVLNPAQDEGAQGNP